ncbi:MAG: alpha/beta hydrolase [Alphaproteobacteria bacterium]
MINNVLIIVGVYLFITAYIYSMQRDFIYFPDVVTPSLPDDAEKIMVKTRDGLNLYGWYLSAHSEVRAVIVLYHGNAGNLEDRLFKAREFTREGYSVLLVEYRGYGGNPGQPDEAGLYMDGRAYLDFVQHDKGYALSDVIIYGESLGSGIATQMATEYEAKALILEVPFDSLISMASQRYFFLPVRLLLKDRYMNIDKISHINMPLLILHGHKDEVIPFSLAKNLFDAAKTPKIFVDFPQGKHNDLYNFGAKERILDFLSGNTAQNTDNRD